MSTTVAKRNPRVKPQRAKPQLGTWWPVANRAKAAYRLSRTRVGEDGLRRCNLSLFNVPGPGPCGGHEWAEVTEDPMTVYGPGGAAERVVRGYVLRHPLSAVQYEVTIDPVDGDTCTCSREGMVEGQCPHLHAIRVYTEKGTLSF